MTRLILPVMAALAVWACLARGLSVALIGFAGAALVIAACIWLVLARLSAVRRAHDVLLFRPGTWWRGLAGGHAGRLILALPVALWSGACVTLALLAAPLPSLTGAALIAVLLPLLARWFAARVAPVVASGQAPRFVIPPAAALAGLVALLLSVALRTAPGDLAQAVAVQAHYTGTSTLLGEIFDLYALGSGFGDLLRGPGGFLLALLLDGSVWFGLAGALSLVLVAPGDLARILAPDGPVRPAALALAACVAVLLVAGLLSFVATLERRAQVLVGQATDVLGPAPRTGGPGAPLSAPDPRPGLLPALPLPSDIRRAVEQERVGALLCPPGTIARLDGFETRLAAIYGEQQARLTSAVTGGFAAMRANVPGFLDWYYSLGAEYLRTINLLIGSGESYLQGQIDSHLDTGSPFAAATAEIAAIAGARDMAAAFDSTRRAILADCRGDLPADDASVTITAERLTDLVTLPLLADRIGLETRLGSAGFSGLAAGIGVAVLAKVGAKVALSGAFKAAAAALVKIAGSKALTLLGGAGVGAVAGGAGGSVVPGAGTGIGAVVGGIAGGVAVMLGVDFALIRLEEEISRAGFEAEIMAAIDATEAEFLAAIGAE